MIEAKGGDHFGIGAISGGNGEGAVGRILTEGFADDVIFGGESELFPVGGESSSKTGLEIQHNIGGIGEFKNGLIVGGGDDHIGGGGKGI